MDTIDLCDFLTESELQQYYNNIKNELKITSVLHLKYASDEDLKQIGLSKPEIRRLRKFYEKYYPHGYLSKIKRMLQNPRPLENGSSHSGSYDTLKLNSPSKVTNKHIIPADSIYVNKQLGVGEFGIVQQGVWTTNGNERIQVAIKCLSRERMQSNPVEFLKEAGIMHSIEHENIVRLYGVVLDTDNLMLVTELAPLRSLLECLKDSGLRNFLTLPTLCDFAGQICNGMMYLENKRLIHRDLAARNILVFSKDKVKISDFGLSRSLGVGKDYYQTNFNINLKLPIAWCAPECINFLRFTNSSDVWAYGVCLWEMFSYGFQPWAALTGHQILEAIDEPNYQRLEQPDCSPREYYALMLKCWQHDPLKRPKFVDICTMLPDMKPEQVKTIISFNEPRKDHLVYRQNEVITVLDKSSSLWKGILNSGKTGLFNPSNTVTYLDSLCLPSSTNTFSRTSERTSKRKLRTEMISRPQNDLKHTGHVGLDGAYFGDVSFLTAPSTYNHLPRQVVAPYKPSDDIDIEQTPLLHPTTPTSPDSVQTASGYFPDTAAASHMFHAQQQPKPPDSYFDFSDPQRLLHETATMKFNNRNPFVNYGTESDLLNFSGGGQSDSRFLSEVNFPEQQEHEKKNENPEDFRHEYHEISDDEIVSTDLGPSLVDEMDFMFRSISASTQKSLSPDFDQTNKKNEMMELTSKLNQKTNGSTKSKKKVGGPTTVKLLSVKDDRILSHAIEIANEISARSMTDLVSDSASTATQSPKRKFSFRFPLAHSVHSSGHANGNGSAAEKDESGNGTGLACSTNNKEKKNFSEDLKNMPDLQHSITEDHRQAYNSLVEKKPTSTLSRLDLMKPSKIMLQAQEEGANASKTLPKNFSNSVLRTFNQIDNPLRILRDKNFTAIQSRVRNHAMTVDEVAVDLDENCESPSYLTNINTYSYPEENTSNPIPLPPRDRNKPATLVNKKRHIRKHALIIPACNVQRTLNKLDASSTNNPALYSDQKIINMETNHENNGYCDRFDEKNIPLGSRTYENFEMLKRNNFESDTASLHFETILESVDHNILDERNDKFASPNHRLAPKAMPESSESYSTEDDDEVAVDSVDGAKALHVTSSNSVSCEDLLELSEKKPKGRERGVESDEVRIMTKVLGTKVPAETCIRSLELIEWDVHKAIKIIKLHSLVEDHVKRSGKANPPDLEQCAKQLDETNWDLHKATVQIKSPFWSN